jgi:hypothetical protein
MLKKFLSFVLTGFIALALFACDGDSNSLQAPVQDPPQVGMESSSSEETEISSSSLETLAVSSSSEVTEISSSSLKTSAKSSSSQDVSESSSSQESVGSSSSEESVLLSSVSEKLPFDTTGIKPHYLKYTVDPDTFSNETREKAGQFLGHYITVEEYIEPFCDVVHIYENGKIVTAFTGYLDVSNCVLAVQGDSLMFANVRNCQSLPIWGACQNEEAYSRKIKVGDDVFYVGVSEEQLQLTQLTDSTMTVWVAANPSYVPSPKTWKKSVFGSTSMVTFAENKVDPNYVDTIFIDKYGLAITDWDRTWIFENETCTTVDFVQDAARTPEEQCEDWEKYRNSFVDCTARNMKTPEGVYPRLCRPTSTRFYENSVWCILDSEMPTVKN